MIKVARADRRPDTLRRRAAAETRRLIDAYNDDTAAYRSGRKSFSRGEDVQIKSSVYGAESVKTQLIDQQHGKCAFCETKITATQYGDVEHFRPKRGYVQNAGDALQRPGYYWLAYDWDNLFLCCELCNQRHKRNYFPLLNPGSRAIDHMHDVATEDPVFIKPDVEDPEDFIRFNGHIAVGCDRGGRGERTIDDLDLNRKPLRDLRFEIYQQLKLIYRMLQNGQIPDEEAEEARQILQNAQNASSSYAAMMRAANAQDYP